MAEQPEESVSSDMENMSNPRSVFLVDSNDEDLDNQATAASLERSRHFSSSQIHEILLCTFFFATSWFIHIFGPHRRPIPFQLLENSNDYVRNLTNDETYVGDTVSDVALVLLAAIGPLLSQLVLSRFLVRDISAVHSTLCVYFTSFGLNAMATESVKLYVGYLRPIFYDICQPSEDYQTCSDGDASDVRKSFPSGHASQSFCGLTLLTLFLHHQFGIPSARRQQGASGQHENVRWSPRKEPTTARIVSVLSLLPMALALFIAASRVRDNKHFPADVVAGSLLGASISSFVHSLWFDH